MDEEPIGAVQRKPISKLLGRPFRRGVVSEIPVHDSACADVEHHEDVQPLKGRGHDDEEVASQHDASIIVEECCPRLGKSATSAPGPRRHVPSHRTRRERLTELTQSSAAIRSSPQVWFFAAIYAISCCTSAGIRGRPRGRDFRRQKRRNRSRCHRTRVSGRTIVKRWRHSTTRDRRTSVVRAARLDLAFDVTPELLPEEEVLGRQLRTGPYHRPQQSQQVCE